MFADGLRPVYSSGACEIDLARRELRILGSPALVGGRAFGVLEVLAQSAGELVTKDELMLRVWPGATVNDNTLQMHISALRKALGPRRTILKTESGRGYRLMGDWTVELQKPATLSTIFRAPSAPEGAPPTNIPFLAGGLIGRAAAVQRLRDLLSAYRLVTLTGAGGIGKSSLALHAARDIASEFAGGGWFVELASLSDPNLVPSAVTNVLGLTLTGAEISAAAIARAISDRNLLVVLDNCEHVVDEAARLAETFLYECPRITVLATSREVLRIPGEYVYRVPPLEVPPDEAEASCILGHSAVELFVARVKESDSDFLPSAEHLPSVAAICRHLDGIPLAIEFAAARAAIFGTERVAAGLDNRFALLTSRRRTALPRHQTLKATLDWSYELLPEIERELLRRLAVFAGGFTLDAAEAVMRSTEHAISSIMDRIASLVDKSLITPEKVEPVGRWRLLETTRVYALEKLAESGEADRTLRHHAEFNLSLFAPFASEGRLQNGIDDLDHYRREIDNLRAALNWAFAPGGDAALGSQLAAATTDFWVAASFLAESGEWAGKALAQIGDAAGTRVEMILQCALGLALVYTRGMDALAREALTRALTLAQELDDFDYQQRATHDLWLFLARAGALRDALALGRQYEAVARSRDAHSQAVADWLIGIPQTYLAEHIEATERLQRAIGLYPVARRHQDLIRFGGDLRASALGHLTVDLLSRGLLDAAALAAMAAVEEAHSTNQPTVICVALAWAAGFIYLSLGELDNAERYGEELADLAHKHALRPFNAAALCIRGSLAAKRGRPEIGVSSFRSGLTEMKEARYLLFYPFFLAEFAAVLGQIGLVHEGLDEIEKALHVAIEIGYRWFVPEILRIKGELLGLRDCADADQAMMEDLFRQSMNQAREQHALYWELCAALSLAKLIRSRGGKTEGRVVLAGVYDRLTEGFSASKVKEAKALLDQLV
jgi:non-specific serine/threonine protein kinase